MGNVIGLGQLRSDTCGYLDRVAARETLDVVRRGRLVARIVSAGGEYRPAPVASRTAGARGRVGLDELRTQAGRWFDRVAAGETIEIVRRGKLVARIVSTDGNPRASH